MSERKKTVNTGRKQDGRFRKGHSGNPQGRPCGSRNQTTLAVQHLLENDAEAISRKAIEMAKEGDMQAIKLIMERIIPARKDSPITLPLPAISSAQDVLEAYTLITEAVTQGEITPLEGQSLFAILENGRKVIETVELERRVSRLEGKDETD